MNYNYTRLQTTHTDVMMLCYDEETNHKIKTTRPTSQIILIIMTTVQKFNHFTDTLNYTYN